MMTCNAACSPRWSRRRTGYFVVHVLPDGSRRVVDELYAPWAMALARAEALALALCREAERGNTDAAGMVEIVAMDHGTVLLQLLVLNHESADR